MLKSIFKPLEKPNKPTYFQQKIIEDTEEIPEGWTDNLENIPKPDWEKEEDIIEKPKNVGVKPNISSAEVNIS